MNTEKKHGILQEWKRKMLQSIAYLDLLDTAVKK